MKEKKKIIIICLFVMIVAVGGYLGIKYYLEKDLEQTKQELQETIEKYGTVKQENVSTIIAKLNTEIMDSGTNTPATEDSLVIENQLYWYAITENISCYIKPQKFTGKKEEDIVEMVALWYEKSEDEQTIEQYAKYLIKANNEDLTEKEIDQIIKDAKKLSPKNQNAQSGKGLAVAFKEADNHYEYQVIRIYK